MCKSLIVILFWLVSVAANAELNVVQEMNRKSVLESGFKPDLTEIAKHPLGSRGNPVRVTGSAGVHEYVGHLSCPNGGRPFAKREGSSGVGPYGFVIDSYMVGCYLQGKTDFYSIHIDYYHLEADTSLLKLADFATDVHHDLFALTRGCISGISSTMPGNETRKTELRDALAPFCQCVTTEAADSFWGRDILPDAIGEVMNQAVTSGKCVLPDLSGGQQ
jgi:hypothetical protein|tara:strand:+ start:2138 stop:2794 length:657 start_codon:yes stop_codon:yes gene_type:complete